MADPPHGKCGNGGPVSAPSASLPPEQIANVPAPPPLMEMNSIFLQSIMEMQKAISEVGTKTDRLILDVSKQNKKIETIKGQISFVKGASWIIGILLTAAITAGIAFGTALYNRTTNPRLGQTGYGPASKLPSVP